MESDSASLREQLSARLGKEKLENLIREKEEQFHGLLSQDAALFAISREMKVETPKKPIPLSELTPEMKRVSVVARVKQVYEAKRFERNGKEGRVCRILVGDDKAETALVLWNEDAEKAESGRIGPGDLLELRGAYMKNGELHLGYGGSVEITEKKPEKRIRELSEGEFFGITVSVSGQPNVRPYSRDGEKHEMCSCEVSDGTSGSRLVLWEPNSRALEGAAPGDLVKLEGARLKGDEIHVGRGATARLIKRPISPGELTSDFTGDLEGEISEADASGDGITARMRGGGESEIKFSKSLSLRLLGLKSLPDDVKLETILKIKGRGLAGSRLRVRGKAGAKDGRLQFTVEKILS